MGSERHRRSGVVLNLTPLIDIVFLLLVFFMLTAHFIEDEAIGIDLPDAQHATAGDEDSLVEVIVDREGGIWVDGQSVPPDDLEPALRSILHAPDKRFVRLRGDHQSRLGLAVRVIDAARGAGAETLDIVTERP